MRYQIEYALDAQKTLAKYKKSNPIAYKKVESLIKELHDHPRTGTGHPEPLTKGSQVTYSRRISGHNRIIYDIYDDRVVVLVLSLEGHYDDK
jgi:toxin YoeB